MTRARRLTPEGCRRAQEFLDQLRADTSVEPSTPNEILYGPECARPFLDAPQVSHVTLHTRRDAAEYIDSLSPSITASLADDWALWSWLGMFHLSDIITPQRRSRVSAEHETFVLEPHGQQARGRYRHYLWMSWRLATHYGDEARFSLDRDITEIGEITRQTTNSPRVFNSVAVARLIWALFTDGHRLKRGAVNKTGRGTLRHLLRVLGQLERTYDVYGMELEALLDVLPADFDRWMAVD